MCLLLAFFLCLLLAATYRRNNKEIASPGVLFISPFIAMCLIAQIYSKYWNFQMHFNTFFVILVGCIFFIIGTALGQKIKIKVGYNNEITEDRYVSTWKYAFLLIVAVTCYFMKIRYIMRWSGASTLSKALVVYNNNLKIDGATDMIKYPGWLSIGLDISEAFGFVISCVFAQKILLKIRERKSMIWVLACFIACAIGGASSGGRGGTVQIAIAFMTIYLILCQRKYQWQKPISLKQVFFILILVAGVIVLFIASITWVGRYDVYQYGRYICNYIGAQVYNLDYFLNVSFEPAQIVGMYTFSPLLHKLGSWFGVSSLANFNERATSVLSAGYSTGNVYTAFYDYIRDFGFVGVIVVPLVFGIISQLIYKKARSSPNKHTIHLWLVIYANLAYVIMFSYFSDKFGSLFFTPSMIKKIILMFVLSWFLFDFRIVGTKIKVRKIPLLHGNSRVQKPSLNTLK